MLGIVKRMQQTPYTMYFTMMPISQINAINNIPVLNIILFINRMYFDISDRVDEKEIYMEGW